MSVKTPHRTRCPVSTSPSMPSGSRSVKLTRRARLTVGSGHPYELTGTPRPGSTWAVGIAATRRPGSRSLEPRMPEPITTGARLRHRLVHQHRPVRGQPDRRYPAVLHPGGRRYRLDRRERRLPRVQVPADQPVHVRPRGRQDHAGRVHRVPAALGRDDHAVRGLGRETPYRSQNAAVSASAGSISATRTSSATGQSPSATATGAASNSGWDNAGDETTASHSCRHPTRSPPHFPPALNHSRPTTPIRPSPAPY